MGAASSFTTLGALLHAAERQLAAGSSPRLDAELLLAALLGTTRAQLHARAAEPVAATLATHYLALIARRAGGEPVAYLTGRRDFWTLSLEVTPAVLVPRPETELVVERALALAGPEPAAVADLGTGSGAIALALASERAHWRIVATDRSPAALAIARGNALRLGLHNVEFRLGEWCAPLAGQRLRLIASNPPYVAAGDPALAEPTLQYEPHAALCPGPSGLEALAAIAEQARAHLHAGGWLVLEHGADQAAALAHRLVALGYAHVRCHRDLAGRDRVTEASWH